MSGMHKRERRPLSGRTNRQPLKTPADVFRRRGSQQLSLDDRHSHSLTSLPSTYTRNTASTRSLKSHSLDDRKLQLRSPKLSSSVSHAHLSASISRPGSRLSGSISCTQIPNSRKAGEDPVNGIPRRLSQSRRMSKNSSLKEGLLQGQASGHLRKASVKSTTSGGSTTTGSAGRRPQTAGGGLKKPSTSTGDSASGNAFGENEMPRPHSARRAACSPTASKKLNHIKQMLRQRYNGKSSLRGVFLSWDVNRDGMVDRWELQEILNICGCPISHEEASEICDIYGNENNVIPYDGFIDLIYERKEISMTEPERATEYLRQRLKELGVSNEQIEDIKQGRLGRQMWKLSDVIPKLRERYKKKKSLTDDFRSIDDNKDGYVSKMELKSLLGRLGYAVHDSEIDNLFDALDESHDNRIEYDEFIDVVFPSNEKEPTFMANQREMIAQKSEGPKRVRKTRKVVKKRSPPPKNVMQHIAHNNDRDYCIRDRVVEEHYYEDETADDGERPETDSPGRRSTVVQRTARGTVVSTVAKQDRDEMLLRIGEQDPLPATGVERALRAAKLRDTVGTLLRKRLSGNSKEGFRIFDRDGDGHITHQEFKVALMNMGVGIDVHDANLLLNFMDRDSSGYVSYDEFCQLIKSTRVGTISQEDLRTIENLEDAERTLRNSISSVANIGMFNRSTSAMTIKLEKKTRRERYLFPKSSMKKDAPPNNTGDDSSGEDDDDAAHADSFKKKLRRAPQRRTHRLGSFHVSQLQGLQRKARHQPYVPNHDMRNIIFGGPSVPLKTESHVYGAGPEVAYHNQPSQKVKRVRQENTRRRKLAAEVQLKESRPERFFDHIVADDRRLRTIIQQRLGYYEALHVRMDKDVKRNAMLF